MNLNLFVGGIRIKIFKLALPVLVVLSLLLSSCNSRDTSTKIGLTSVPVQSTKTPESKRVYPVVVNNGGAIIQFGTTTYHIVSSLAYENFNLDCGALYSVDSKGVSKKIAGIGGERIWALKDSFYVSAEYPSKPESTYKINPSDGKSVTLFDGTIQCVGLDDSTLYYFGYNKSSNITPDFRGLYKYNVDTLETECIFDANDEIRCDFLAKINGKVFYYTTTKDNTVTIYSYDMKSGKTVMLTSKKPDSDKDIPEYSYTVTQLSACGEWLIYCIGDYDGSGHYFYGDMYRIKPDGTENALMNIPDIDQFLVYDNWICYQQFHLEVTNPASIIHPDLTGKQVMKQIYKTIQVTSDGWLLYNNENGDIHRSRIDGSSDTLLLKAKQLPNYLAKNDHYSYNIDVVGDLLYINAEVWGYREGNSWRDQFIDSSFNRIKIDGTGFQTLDQIHGPYTGH